MGVNWSKDIDQTLAAAKGRVQAPHAGVALKSYANFWAHGNRDGSGLHGMRAAHARP